MRIQIRNQKSIIKSYIVRLCVSSSPEGTNKRWIGWRRYWATVCKYIYMLSFVSEFFSFTLFVLSSGTMIRGGCNALRCLLTLVWYTFCGQVFFAFIYSVAIRFRSICRSKDQTRFSGMHQAYTLAHSTSAKSNSTINLVVCMLIVKVRFFSPPVWCFSHFLLLRWFSHCFCCTKFASPFICTFLSAIYFKYENNGLLNHNISHINSKPLPWFRNV